MEVYPLRTNNTPFLARMVDPTSGEQRLLKLKDWPTKEDFSEKLPER